MPSVREMSVSQGVPVATLQHAVAVLADEGLVVVRQGRTAVVAGDTAPDQRHSRTPRARDHDCKRAGCQPHACKPMTAKTIRNVHSILSGAFATARRWEWIRWNPAESARPPSVTNRPMPATAPEDVAKVIAEGRKTNPVLALYLWLVAITGARRKGRPRPGRPATAEQMVVLATDAAEARGIARDTLQHYFKMPNYTNNLRRLGFGEEDFAGGGGDRVIDALVAWGTPETIAGRVRAHRDAGADHVCVQVLGDPRRSPLAEWRELAPALTGL